MKMIEFNNGLEPENNPSKMHLFVNRENIGFEDIDDIDPEQTLEIDPELHMKDSSDPILLKYVKYQRVKSLTIYIEENHGGPRTSIGSLKFYGQTVSNVNMSNFKAKPEPN
jgi:PITH domain